jgi:hypothetical protein
MSLPNDDRRSRLRTVIAGGVGALSIEPELLGVAGLRVMAPRLVTAVRRKSFCPCFRSRRDQGRISAIVFEKAGSFMALSESRVSCAYHPEKTLTGEKGL